MGIYKNDRLAMIQLALEQRERETLSPIATQSAAGVRRFEDTRLEEDYRQPFSTDVDRILHSRAYTRYIDKPRCFI